MSNDRLGLSRALGNVKWFDPLPAMLTPTAIKAILVKGASGPHVPPITGTGCGAFKTVIWKAAHSDDESNQHAFGRPVAEPGGRPFFLAVQPFAGTKSRKIIPSRPAMMPLMDGFSLR